MKKVISFSVLLLLTFQLLAQSKKITIHGTVEDTSIKMVEISYAADTGFSKGEIRKLDVVNGQLFPKDFLRDMNKSRIELKKIVSII